MRKMGTWLIVMVSSAEAMKELRVSLTILAFRKPPRPSGRTELRANGFTLKVSLLRHWYLQRGKKHKKRAFTGCY